jgi:type IV secretory pathway component VirB8
MPPSEKAVVILRKANCFAPAAVLQEIRVFSLERKKQRTFVMVAGAAGTALSL